MRASTSCSRAVGASRAPAWRVAFSIPVTTSGRARCRRLRRRPHARCRQGSRPGPPYHGGVLGDHDPHPGAAFGCATVGPRSAGACPHGSAGGHRRFAPQPKGGGAGAIPAAWGLTVAGQYAWWSVASSRVEYASRPAESLAMSATTLPLPPRRRWRQQRSRGALLLGRLRVEGEREAQGQVLWRVRVKVAGEGAAQLDGGHRQRSSSRWPPGSLTSSNVTALPSSPTLVRHACDRAPARRRGQAAPAHLQLAGSRESGWP
jgi:hypothetical protein